MFFRNWLEDFRNWVWEPPYFLLNFQECLKFSRKKKQKFRNDFFWLNIQKWEFTFGFFSSGIFRKKTVVSVFDRFWDYSSRRSLATWNAGECSCSDSEQDLTFLHLTAQRGGSALPGFLVHHAEYHRTLAIWENTAERGKLVQQTVSRVLCPNHFIKMT